MCLHTFGNFANSTVQVSIVLRSPIQYLHLQKCQAYYKLTLAIANNSQDNCALTKHNLQTADLDC
jgi:hypothetical protein